MGTSRTDGQRRREEILDAALACFAKKGVVATGIEDIRKRAKASPSSVYHLFGGLEEIMLAMLERTFARLFAHLAKRVCATRTAKAAVHALVEAHLEWVFANPAEARVMYQAMALEMSRRTAEALGARKAEQLAPVVAHLAAFVATGDLPRWSPLVFDVVILGSTHEACRRYLGGAPLDPKWMKTSLPALAWAGLESAG